MNIKKSVSKDRFPLGELAKERKKLNDEYVSKNATIVQLKNDLKQVDKDIEKTTKRVCINFNMPCTVLSSHRTNLWFHDTHST